MQSLLGVMDLIGSAMLLELRAQHLSLRFEKYGTKNLIGGNRIVWKGARKHCAFLKNEIARIHERVDKFEYLDIAESAAKLNTAWQEMDLLANPSFIGTVKIL